MTAITDDQIRSLALGAAYGTRPDRGLIAELCLVALGEHPTVSSPEAIALARQHCAEIIAAARLEAPG